MSGSYGTPGRPQPDPKQPVTSMDTESAEATAGAARGRARERDATEVPDGATAPWPEDPGTPAGPDLRDLPSTEGDVVDDDASKDHGVGGRA